MYCELIKAVGRTIYIRWSRVYTEAMIPHWRDYATPRLRRVATMAKRKYKNLVIVHRDPRDR